MVVFIDVDNTLIIYRTGSIHPYWSIAGKPFQPNIKLIEKLERFEGDIVVWSGKGREYARRIAKIVLPETLRYQVDSKLSGFHQIKPGDIVVDDQKEYFTSMKEHGVYIFGPFEDWDYLSKKGGN